MADAQMADSHQPAQDMAADTAPPAADAPPSDAPPADAPPADTPAAVDPPAAPEPALAAASASATPAPEEQQPTPAPAADAESTPAAATPPPAPAPAGPPATASAASTSSGTPQPPAKADAAEPASSKQQEKQEQQPEQQQQQQQGPPLPPGLTEASPSVKREVGAVAAWRANPTAAHPLQSLIQSATDHSELSDARAWSAHFLTLFPTHAPAFLACVELELAHDNLGEAEGLFQRAFSREAHDGKGGGPCFPLGYPPLWTSYLHYIRRQNPLPPIPPSASTLPSAYLSARLSITQAYEFALSHVGLDPLSAPIWREYLAFVREGETRSQWEEQGKVSEYRGVVGRAVRVPMDGLEDIWREYDQFEGQVNRVTAKKFLAERSPTYMTSRTLLKEVRARLPPAALAVPPAPPTRPTWATPADHAVVHAWRAYVDWERSNPCGFEGDDVGECKKRVGYALRRCVGGEGRFYPELWVLAAEWERSEDRIDEAAAFLRAGLEAIPTSFLLSFALAELEEARKALPAVHDIFSALLGALSADLTALKSAIDREVADAVGALTTSYAAAAAAASSNGVGTGTAGGGNQGGEPEMVDVAELLRAQEREKRDRAAEVRKRRAAEVDEKEKGAGLVWILYMRFARRSEGIKAGRAVFAKARKFPHATWQVFEASALIEYHCSKDPAVATRIFELGLKAFGERLEFVDRYLAFLIMINDDQNARVLFERSVAKFTPDESKGLWERWARYEYLFGDLAGAQRLDVRFAEAFPKDTATKNLARRHSYVGIDEIARVDLGFGVRPKPQPQQAQPQQLQQQAHHQQMQMQMQGVPTGPRGPIPTGPRSTLVPAAHAAAAVAPQQPVVYAQAPPPAPPVQAPTIVRQAPPHQPAGPAVAPHPAAAAAVVPPTVAVIPSPNPSPAKRALDPSGGAGDRLSMRNEPLSKRLRADSPAPLAVKREDSPMTHKLPENKPSPSQNATLGWFVGLLPPVGLFDGPVFPVEEVMNCIAASAIAPIAAPPPTIPPPPLARGAGVPSGGGYRYDQAPYQAAAPHGYQQQQQQQYPPVRGPQAYGGRPQAGGWRRG